MDTVLAGDDATVVSDRLELASWNRQRSSEELQSFVSSHYDRLTDDVELGL